MYPYRAYPWHQILPIALLLLTAVLAGAFPSGPMMVAFGIVAVICLATGIWIAYAGTLEKYTEYWESVGRDIDKLQKSPTELWAALGFTAPPSSVTVRQNVTGEPNESSYYAEKDFTLDISSTKMQIIANAILTGAKTFAEGDWKDTEIGTSKIREVKQQMLVAGLLKYRNDRNRLDGMDLTERGLAYLQQCASEWARTDPDLKVLTSRVNPPSNSISRVNPTPS